MGLLERLTDADEPLEAWVCPLGTGGSGLVDLIATGMTPPDRGGLGMRRLDVDARYPAVTFGPIQQSADSGQRWVSNTEPIPFRLGRGVSGYLPAVRFQLLTSAVPGQGEVITSGDILPPVGTDDETVLPVGCLRVVADTFREQREGREPTGVRSEWARRFGAGAAQATSNAATAASADERIAALESAVAALRAQVSSGKAHDHGE